MEYLEIIKEIKEKGYKYKDWGMDRIFYKGSYVDNFPNYIFTYRTTPCNNLNEIIHFTII